MNFGYKCFCLTKWQYEQLRNKGEVRNGDIYVIKENATDLYTVVNGELVKIYEYEGKYNGKEESEFYNSNLGRIT